MNRRGLLSMVHIARKDLALDEGAYRALLERMTGRSSAKDLTDQQLLVVVDEFKRLGFRPKRKRSDRPEVRKIFALWSAMVADGIVRGAPRPALRSFVERMTGVTDPEWLSPEQANIVIEALKAWQRRGR